MARAIWIYVNELSAREAQKKMEKRKSGRNNNNT